MDCFTEAEFKASSTVTHIGTKINYTWFLCQSRQSLVAPRNVRKPFSNVGSGGGAGRHSQQWVYQRESTASYAVKGVHEECENCSKSVSPARCRLPLVAVYALVAQSSLRSALRCC